MAVIPTTRRGLPKADQDENVDIPGDLGALANALDNDIRSFNGTEAARAAFTPPATGFTGTGAGAWKDSERYYATDTGVEWIRSAGGFVALNPKDAAANVPSLRTLGTGATQALPGNHASTTDARTPSAGSIRQSQYDAGANGGPAAGAFYVFAPNAAGPGGAGLARGNPLPMTSERLDVGGNVAGGVLSVPRAGVWAFSWQVRFRDIGSWAVSGLLIGNAIVSHGTWVETPTTARSSGGSLVAVLAAGATVGVTIDSGVADVGYVAENNGQDTYFCGQFVGPA